MLMLGVGRFAPKCWEHVDMSDQNFFAGRACRAAPAYPYTQPSTQLSPVRETLSCGLCSETSVSFLSEKFRVLGVSFALRFLRAILHLGHRSRGVCFETILNPIFHARFLAFSGCFLLVSDFRLEACGLAGLLVLVRGVAGSPHSDRNVSTTAWPWGSFMVHRFCSVCACCVA